MKLTLLPIVALLVALLRTTALLADDPMTAHRERINALRSESAFHQIEEYCRQQLVRTALTEIEKHELTLELSQTALENALRNPADRARWETALQTPIITLDVLPDNSRREQLRLQAGLAHLAHADVVRPLFAESDEAWEPTRAALRQTVKLFREAREQIEVDARTAPRGAPKNLTAGAIAPFTAEQLRSLDRHSAFLLAESYRRQAETYPTASGDRLHAARQAEELYRALAELENIVPQTWPSRVRLIGVYRLLGDHSAAAQAMSRCADAELPKQLRSPFRAESIRTFLAEENLTEALRIVAEARTSEQKRSLEEDVAFLEAFLAIAKPHQVPAATEINLARHVHKIGALWGKQRGEEAAAHVADELTAGRITGDAELWELAGDVYAQSKRADDALNAYQQAQTLAEQQSGIDRAMRSGNKAAAIDRAAGDFDQSSERLRALAGSHPNHELAASHHWLAIRDAAEAHASEEAQQELLREHLRHWPNGETATTVRELLADESRNHK